MFSCFHLIVRLLSTGLASGPKQTADDDNNDDDIDDDVVN